MRDIVPPEGELRRRVANAILDVYEAYGFELIETPALEDLEVLLGSGGGDNEKLIFKILKRGERLEDERQRGGELAGAGLRFDLTVPLARFVANHLNELPMPFKVTHIAPVWRGERPARGRFREFVQCDIDIVGEPSVAAEVELCGATLDALERTGVRGCTVKVNDRRLLRTVVEHYLGPIEDFSTIFIELDKLERDGAEPVARRLRQSEQGFDPAGVGGLLEWVQDGDLEVGPPEVVRDLKKTLSSLSGQGYAAAFDPALVRGIGYYTGQIFEIRRPDVPYSLGGGGRYDGMTARFGAPALPMCGFSIGFERVCELVDHALFARGQHRVAVTCAGEDELLRSLAVARAKRAGDANLVFSVLRRARNARKQHEDLQRLGYDEILDGKEFGREL